MMHKVLILFLFIFAGVHIIAQNKCIDSFENKSLYNDQYKYIISHISTPLPDKDSATVYAAQSSLLKKRGKNIVWKKLINKITDTRFVTNSNNILALFNFEPSGPSNGDRGFAKISASGDVIWAKKITSLNRDFNNYGFIYNTSKGKDDDIVFSSPYYNSINIVVLDSNASIIKWNKTINLSFLNGEYIKGVNTTTDNNSIYITGVVQQLQLSPDILTNYLLFLKLDYKTGNIISKTYYRFNDQVSRSEPTGQTTLITGYFYETFDFKSTVDNELVLAGRKSGANSFFAIKLDTSFNILNQHIYKYPNQLNFLFAGDYNTLPCIDENGNILFANIKDSVIIPLSTNSCYYFSVDDKLKITIQRKQDIIETGLNTKGYRLNVVPYLKNKNEGELIYHTNYSQVDSVLHIVSIAKDIKGNNCMGNESDLINIETPAYKQLPAPDILSITPLPLNITPYNLTSQNELVEDRKFCTQISICDTIKIKGAEKYCLLNPVATFTLYKNPQCLRKVNWITDTTAIKITGKPNDTTINVSFLKPYRGYIKVQFEGCVLKDSLYIDVNAPMQPVYLGKDTMHCPNKTIILNAGIGFKKYKWQDNSTNTGFTASQPGTYFVEVMDSCDNIFKDTILIKPMDVNLNLSYPDNVCLYDTAFVKLSPSLKNYLWYPANTAIIQNDILKLFPVTNTLFSISGERFSGCLLSGNLLIKIINCPIYIYFPNAFTPNNDSKNDVFKPMISSRMEQYQFSIYNRYGQMIFNTNNTNKGWDGAVKGSGQNTGVFTWTCTYKFVNKALVSKKGTVLLIK